MAKAAAKASTTSKSTSKPASKGAAKETKAPRATKPKKALVIVESPSKAKTIQKYLGREYIVKASVGHIKDLPKSKLGVDPKKGFRAGLPAHSRPRSRSSKSSRKFSEEVPELYLATDPDREGEAIAWHINEELKAKGKKVHRVLFNAITKPAILEAMSKPAEAQRRQIPRPAGSPHSGSPGGLQDQPAALGQGEARNLRGPRAIGRAAPDRGPRSRDQSVQARRVLDGRRHFLERRNRLRSQPVQDRRQRS